MATSIDAEFTPFGAVKLSTIHKGHLVTMQYFGYSVTVAKKLFKQHLKTL
jgi:hypothetical protein